MALPSGDSLLARNYKSASQRARVVTEAWIKDYGYCLACESDRLAQTSANTQARDFECEKCGHPYELKSSIKPLGHRIPDGAYASMMRRIQAGTVPSFLLLQYTATWELTNLSAVHHVFITQQAIEERKPLAATARRAGWIGCNIRLSAIPPEGRIELVQDGQQMPRNDCRRHFGNAERLSSLSPSVRGWTATVLTLLHKLNKDKFTLGEAYGLQSELERIFPGNKNIRPKIRQQLQVLRDSGLVNFESRGVYSLKDSTLPVR